MDTTSRIRVVLVVAAAALLVSGLLWLLCSCSEPSLLFRYGTTSLRSTLKLPWFGLQNGVTSRDCLCWPDTFLSLMLPSYYIVSSLKPLCFHFWRLYLDQLKPNISAETCKLTYRPAGCEILPWQTLKESDNSRKGLLFLELSLQKVGWKRATWSLLCWLLFLVILVVRTWAIWGRGKRVGYTLLAASIFAVVPVLIIENIFLKSIVCEVLSSSISSAFHSPQILQFRHIPGLQLQGNFLALSSFRSCWVQFQQMFANIRKSRYRSQFRDSHYFWDLFVHL